MAKCRLPMFGGGENLTQALDSQNAIITELEQKLEGKAIGGGEEVDITPEVNEYTNVLAEVIAELEGKSGISGGSGQYVWERSLYNPIEITINAVATGNPCYIEMNSDDVDLTTVTGDFFTGLEGTYSSNIPWIIKSGTVMNFNGTDYTLLYTPSTRRFAVGFSDSTLGVWIPTNVLGEKENITYIVSDNSTEYPDRATHTDGYWYEKYTSDGGIDLSSAGITKIAIDTFTLSSKAYNTTINHSLGVVPKFAIITGGSYSAYNGGSSSLHVDYGMFVKRQSGNTGVWLLPNKDYAGNNTMFPSDAPNNYSNAITESTIQFNCKNTSNANTNTAYLLAGVEYTLITMA